MRWNGLVIEADPAFPVMGEQRYPLKTLPANS
jgi:hypothetical protein